MLKDPAIKNILRKPTDQEWKVLVTQFPRLNREEVEFLEEDANSSKYNCISWSLGSIHWINAPLRLSAFEVLYQSHSYTPVRPLSADAAIDGWGLNKIRMDHASKLWNGRWTSKINDNQCITHNRDGLRRDGPITGYGKVQVSFRLSGQLQEPAQTIDLLSADEKNVLSKKLGLKNVDRASIDEFENAFQCWKNTWFANDVRFSGNTYRRARGEAFTSLIKKGQPIIRLVVEKLADPDNFMALVLYEQLGPDPRFLAPIEPGTLESEQARSLRVVRLWLQQ